MRERRMSHTRDRSCTTSVSIANVTTFDTPLFEIKDVRYAAMSVEWDCKKKKHQESQSDCVLMKWNNKPLLIWHEISSKQASRWFESVKNERHSKKKVIMILAPWGVMDVTKRDGPDVQTKKKKKGQEQCNGEWGGKTNLTFGKTWNTKLPNSSNEDAFHGNASMRP